MGAGERWDKADDAKLLHVFKTEPGLEKKLETADVQDVFRRHFPGKKFVNFSPVYKRKARQYALTQTLNKARKKEAEQKKGKRGKFLVGVLCNHSVLSSSFLFCCRYIDIDKVDEDDSSETDEEGSDEEEDNSAEDEDTKMPPKKTPSKAAAKPKATVESATNSMASMSVSGFKPYSMAFQSPYMVRSFLHNDRKGCTVEFLVLTVSEDDIRLSVDPGGLVLSLGIVMPEFFPEEERVLVSNMGVAGFDNNTNQYTAHQHVVQAIRREYAAEPEIVGAPQKVKLPFQCELDIAGQEMVLFNGDEEISAGLGGVQQYFSVLKVDLLAVERTTARKSKPAIRIVGSPSLADHNAAANNAAQGQQQQNQG